MLTLRELEIEPRMRNYEAILIDSRFLCEIPRDISEMSSAGHWLLPGKYGKWEKEQFPVG